MTFEIKKTLVQCVVCGNKRLVYKSALREHPNKGRYCSRKCQGKVVGIKSKAKRDTKTGKYAKA